MKPAFGLATPRSFFTSVNVSSSERSCFHIRYAMTIDDERETPWWQWTYTVPPPLMEVLMKLMAS